MSFDWSKFRKSSCQKQKCRLNWYFAEMILGWSCTQLVNSLLIGNSKWTPWHGNLWEFYIFIFFSETVEQVSTKPVFVFNCLFYRNKSFWYYFCPGNYMPGDRLQALWSLWFTFWSSSLKPMNMFQSNWVEMLGRGILPDSWNWFISRIQHGHHGKSFILIDPIFKYLLVRKYNAEMIVRLSWTQLVNCLLIENSKWSLLWNLL